MVGTNTVLLLLACLPTSHLFVLKPHASRFRFRPLGCAISPSLTVLIPAYNEEDRIQETLVKYSKYLSVASNHPFAHVSILVVDDGSSDQTQRVVQQEKHRTSVPLDCVRMNVNRGKGAALAFGMDHVARHAPTDLILTADADGSARIEDLHVLYEGLVECLAATANNATTTHENATTTASTTTTTTNTDTSKKTVADELILIHGYRVYAEDDQASPLRLLFRWGFRTLVRLIASSSKSLWVRDTQCGFKLMTRTAATTLYANLTVPGWSHDVEVLLRAVRHHGVHVAERPIQWQDKEGSKLIDTQQQSAWDVVRVCANMLEDVWELRQRYGSSK